MSISVSAPAAAKVAFSGTCCAALAACIGEPLNWLGAGFLPGQPNSACEVFLFEERATSATHPAVKVVGSPFAKWESTIKAQMITCKEDSTFLSGAVWAECELTGPAALEHPMSSHDAISTIQIDALDRILVRASLDGVSCRKLS